MRRLIAVRRHRMKHSVRHSHVRRIRRRMRPANWPADTLRNRQAWKEELNWLTDQELSRGQLSDTLKGRQHQLQRMLAIPSQKPFRWQGARWTPEDAIYEELRTIDAKLRQIPPRHQMVQEKKSIIDEYGKLKKAHDDASEMYYKHRNSPFQDERIAAEMSEALTRDYRHQMEDLNNRFSNLQVSSKEYIDKLNQRRDKLVTKVPPRESQMAEHRKRVTAPLWSGWRRSV